MYRATATEQRMQYCGCRSVDGNHRRLFVAVCTTMPSYGIVGSTLPVFTLALFYRTTPV